MPVSEGPAPVSVEVGDPVELALAAALTKASEAGRWDVVATLAQELQARRKALASGNVVSIDPAKRHHPKG